MINVSDYNQIISSNYELPKCYYRYVAPSSEEEEELMEYEVDQDDVAWLKNHPTYGINGKDSYQISLDTFEKILNTLELLTKNGDPVAPNDAEINCYNCFTSPHPEYSKLITEIRTYWYNKRHKLHKPLCRKFWPQTPVTDTNPHLVFRPREKERYKLRKQRKSDEDAYNKLIELRNNLYEVKQIIEVILKKEKVKLNALEFMCEEYEQRLFDIDITNQGKERKRNAQLMEGLKDLISGNYLTIRTKNIINDDRKHIRTSDGLMPLSMGNYNNQRKRTYNNDIVNRNNKLICAYLNHIATDGDYEGCIPIIGLGPSLEKSTAMLPPLILPKYYNKHPSDIGSLIPTYSPNDKEIEHVSKYLLRPRIGRGGRLILDRIPVNDSNRWYNKTEHYISPPLLFIKDKCGIEDNTTVIAELQQKEEEGIQPYHPLPFVIGTSDTSYKLSEVNYNWNKIYASVQKMTFPSDALKVKCPAPETMLSSNASELFRFNL